MWVCIALIVVFVLIVWLPLVFHPLTLDETGTVWEISGGIRDIARRCVVLPQSILYTFLLWAETRLVGISEFALRLPSLIASLLTLFLLYRLGSKTIGVRHASLLPLFWLLFVDPAELATQARVYALTMCVAAFSLYEAAIFLSDGKTRALWLFAIAAAVSVYFSPVFTLPLVGTGLFLLVLRWLRKIRTAEVLLILGIWVLMLSPLIPQTRAIAASASVHTIRNYIRNRDDLFSAFAPPAIAFGFVAGFVMAVSREKPKEDSQPGLELTILVGLIAVMSIVPLYFLTQLTAVKLWATRYMCLAFAPLAFLYAVISARYLRPSGRVVAVLVPALVLFAPSFTTRKTSAMQVAESYPKIVSLIATERANEPIYLFSQFAESWRWHFPVSSSDKEWLLSPFRYYKLDRPYELLPHTLEQCDPAFRAALLKQLQTAPTFIVAGPILPAWLQTATGDTHSVRFLSRQENVYFIAVFTRIASGAPQSSALPHEAPRESASR